MSSQLASALVPAGHLVPSHARSLSVHARDAWSTRAAPSRRPRRRTRTDLRFRSLAEKRVCAYSPPAGEPFGGPSAQPPHNKGPTRGVRTCPHWVRREDRKVLQRSEDARRGFVAVPGRCWRLGYSRQVQATDRRETPSLDRALVLAEGRIGHGTSERRAARQHGRRHVRGCGRRRAGVATKLIRRFAPLIAATLCVAALPFAAAGGLTTPLVPGVPVPSSISQQDCSTTNVETAMQAWLSSLPANTVVNATGDCFQVSSLYFLYADGLTINGGTWMDDQAPTSSTTLTSANLQAVWYFEDGTDITLENLTVVGVNTCACDYDNEAAAFQSGIRSDGTDGLTVTNVTVEDVFGDGLTLNGGFAGPTTKASVDGLTISGVGRQAVTLSSVSDSTLADITITNPGEDDFDAEANLASEGINDVTINGCTVSGTGRVFFGNDGQGGGNVSGTNSADDVIENCTMENAQTGDVIEDWTPAGLGVRGPFTFSNDTFDCGTSVYVGCVDLIGADVNIVDSTLTFPADAYSLYREVWNIDPTSTLNFLDDTVDGYSSENDGNTCDVTIRGGTWTPVNSASSATPPTCVSTSIPAPHSATASPLPPSAPDSRRQRITAIGSWAPTEAFSPSGRPNSTAPRVRSSSSAPWWALRRVREGRVLACGLRRWGLRLQCPLRWLDTGPRIAPGGLGPS